MNKIERRKINLHEYADESELYSLIYGENYYNENEDIILEYIETNWVDFDDNGGYGTKETIFKRIFDGAIFKMNSIHSYDYLEIEKYVLEEVFPEEKTIIVYN